MNIGEANDVVTVLRAYRGRTPAWGTTRDQLDQAGSRLIERAAKALNVSVEHIVGDINRPPAVDPTSYTAPWIVDPAVVSPVNDYGLPFYDGRTIVCDAAMTSRTHGMCAGCTGCQCHLLINHPHTSRYAHAVIEATL